MAFTPEPSQLPLPGAGFGRGFPVPLLYSQSCVHQSRIVGTLAAMITLFAVVHRHEKKLRQKLERPMIGGKGQAERFRGIFDGRLQRGGLTARTVLPIGGFGSHDGEPRFLGGKNRIKNMEKNDE